jgi:hypothetical protein
MGERKHHICPDNGKLKEKDFNFSLFLFPWAPDWYDS